LIQQVLMHRSWIAARRFHRLQYLFGRRAEVLAPSLQVVVVVGVDLIRKRVVQRWLHGLRPEEVDESGGVGVPAVRALQCGAWRTFASNWHAQQT
jgi:hypothetical protein